MDALIERIETAKTDNTALDSLITEYLPFIKRAAAEACISGMEYDDRFSLAMLSFMVCVKQYKAERGNFIAYAAACIRNRLIDESRKQSKYNRRVIPLFPEGDDKAEETAADKASIDAYNRDKERESLSNEINVFSGQLKEYNITFNELPSICPKQTVTRKKCVDIGRYAAETAEIKNTLIKHRRLAQSELASKFNLSEKTIEKHRKYIISIVLLYTGDYPFIRAFLPQYN